MGAGPNSTGQEVRRQARERRNRAEQERNPPHQATLAIQTADSGRPAAVAEDKGTSRPPTILERIHNTFIGKSHQQPRREARARGRSVDRYEEDHRRVRPRRDSFDGTEHGGVRVVSTEVDGDMGAGRYVELSINQPPSQYTDTASATGLITPAVPVTRLGASFPDSSTKRSPKGSTSDVNYELLYAEEQKRWHTETERLQEEILNLKRVHDEALHQIDGLEAENSSQKAQIELNASRHQRLQKAKEAQSQQYQEFLSQHKARVQKLETENVEYQVQLEKMSQIISQLNKRGLPLPADDNHFASEFDGVIGNIRQWARAYTRGQKPLTLEGFEEMPMSEVMEEQLKASFLDLDSLLSSPNVGSKVRTRCVEAFLCRELLRPYLSITGRPMGIAEKQLEPYYSLSKAITCTEEEAAYFRALTVHLLTKDSAIFEEEQTQQIDHITEYLFTQVEDFGDTKRGASKQGLRKVVAQVAKLSLEVAKLPFYFQPVDFQLGSKYQQLWMEDMETAEDDQVNHTGITIILCDAWVKVEFDRDGNAAIRKSRPNVITKARVSCIN